MIGYCECARERWCALVDLYVFLFFYRVKNVCLVSTILRKTAKESTKLQQTTKHCNTKITHKNSETGCKLTLHTINLFVFLSLSLSLSPSLSLTFFLSHSLSLSFFSPLSLWSDRWLLEDSAIHWNTLQHCKTLQDTARHCKTLQDTATQRQPCSNRWVLRDAGTHCNTLQHTATHCNTKETTMQQRWVL